jgi:hypothetical protein
MQLVCPKDGPVKTEADFKGKTLGVWFFGNEYPFFAWMNKLGLSTEGGPDGDPTHVRIHEKAAPQIGGASDRTTSGSSTTRRQRSPSLRTSG